MKTHLNRSLRERRKVKGVEAIYNKSINSMIIDDDDLKRIDMHWFDVNVVSRKENYCGTFTYLVTCLTSLISTPREKDCSSKTTRVLCVFLFRDFRTLKIRSSLSTVTRCRDREITEVLCNHFDSFGQSRIPYLLSTVVNLRLTTCDKGKALTLYKRRETLTTCV